MRGEVEVARREIKFLVVVRIVGNVHLAVAAGQTSVGVHHHRRVVVDALGAALEERTDDDDLARGGGRAQRLGGRSGNRLGEVEVARLLGLAEIARAEQFLETDDLGAARGRLVDSRERLVQIASRLGLAAHLHQRDTKRLGTHDLS